jgi:hypothetical protein
MNLTNHPKKTTKQLLTSLSRRLEAKSGLAQNGCVEWFGCRDVYGYGVLKCGPKMIKAHRGAWFLMTGEMPSSDVVVMHICDNRRCINAAHLRVGTNDENMRDMVAKGRASRGEVHPRTTLTNDQVAWVKAARRNGWRVKAIAVEVGCKEPVIWGILGGRTWRHVSAEGATT